VPRISVFDVVPANLALFDPLSPGGGSCVSRMCWCGIGQEDDNKRKWETPMTMELASCQNAISSRQHNRYAQDKSY